MSEADQLGAVDQAYRLARSAIGHYRLAEARQHLDDARHLLASIHGAAWFEPDLRLRLTESWLTCDDHGLSTALEQVSMARRDAEGAGRDDLCSLAHIQAGVLCARAGHIEMALEELRAAVELSGSLPVEDRVRLLINKGAIGSQTGALDEAADDLRSAAGMASRLPEYAFMATHNLGFVEYLRGDLPAALRRMAEADELEAGVDRSVSRLDRARVLMEVGLVDDAIDLLAAAIEVMREAHMSEELADALLEQARCELLRGRAADAVRRVDEIVGNADGRGEQTRELDARAVRLEALAMHPASDAPRLVAEAEILAKKARKAGMGWLADRATAVWVILAERAGLRVDDRVVGRLLWRMRDSPYLATRALAVLAQLSRASTTAERLRLVRAAAADVASARAGMSSLDLRTAVAIHITSVIALDLEWAVDSRNAWTALSATERWRTALASVPSVLPPADAEVAALWSRLRQYHEELRTAASEQSRVLRTGVARIEHQLREESWTGGRGSAMTGHRRPRREELGTATVLSYFWVSEDLHVVVIAPGRKAELVRVGDREDMPDLMARATADAGAAARAPHGPLAAAVVSSLHGSLERLDALLLPDLQEGPIVIVPGGALAHLPWGMLPRLRERSVTLSRSVTAWHAGATRLTAAPSVAVAVGPGLELGQREVDLVRASWPGASQVPGEPVAVAAALAAHDVVHVAAHGEHRADNPLFSSLLLRGGALFAHELEGITLASSLVVLSACSAGRARYRPGDEALGLTSSLLAMGVKAVVAPLTDVPDSVACETMGEFHRRLAAGDDGPAALAAASSDLLARSFTWFGSNWRANSSP